MIRKFNERHGVYIEEIAGQKKLAFSKSEMDDFYDMIQLSKQGNYRGSVLQFYDFENGKIYRPFERRKNIIYGNPIFSKGDYYFLQGDYDTGNITLYKFFPNKILEKVTVLSMEKIDLYNLQLIGNDVHIISQNELFRCYYPEQFTFSLESEENVCLIEENCVYSEKWIEEGWDEENNCATENYKFYYKTLIRDFNGNIISEEIGLLYQNIDGTWWIA